jgi:predicted thioesterase
LILKFKIVAHDENEKIGEGILTRNVVVVDNYLKKIDEKLK